jgi:K+-transporting ATPase KdpF subunit
VGVRASRKDVVTLVYGLAGMLALFLFGYLLYALLRAEQF